MYKPTEPAAGWWALLTVTALANFPPHIHVENPPFAANEAQPGKGNIMPFLDGFKAFRANRRLHYQIQNAAICCILFATVAPWFWPKLELASRTVAVIALLVLSAKILFQPEVMCRIPEMKFEYVRGVRNEIVRFPRLYIAQTGS